jgi:hypothetical protein
VAPTPNRRRRRHHRVAAVPVRRARQPATAWPHSTRGAGRTPMPEGLGRGGGDGRRRRRPARARHPVRARRRLLDGKRHRPGAGASPPELVRRLVLVSTHARPDALFRSQVKFWRWLAEMAPSERAFYEGFFTCIYTRAHADGTVDQLIERRWPPHTSSPSRPCRRTSTPASRMTRPTASGESPRRRWSSPTGSTRSCRPASADPSPDPSPAPGPRSRRTNPTGPFRRSLTTGTPASMPSGARPKASPQAPRHASRWVCRSPERPGQPAGASDVLSLVSKRGDQRPRRSFPRDTPRRLCPEFVEKQRCQRSLVRSFARWRVLCPGPDRKGRWSSRSKPSTGQARAMGAKTTEAKRLHAVGDELPGM